MKQKLTKFFNLIKNDKQAKTLTIIVILLLFIFTLGYFLSMFNGSNVKEVANINVNGLSFNMTTNTGESDDRVLHLQAGKTEEFNIVLTNLNKINTKYELIYELCNDSKCTSTYKSIPSTVTVGKEEESTEINGIINSNNKKVITIITNNTSSTDYYIKLSLNAGYEWNDLALINQINEKYNAKEVRNIIAYVDGINVGNTTPTDCSYTASAKILKNGEMVETEDIELTCDYYKNKWSMNLKDLMSIPDKIELYFTSTGVPADALIKGFEYIAPTTSYPEPYYTFTAPVDGTYKLETWGAQGGCSLDGNKQTCTKLGYGGYSVGEITLKKGKVLYIYVGGAGANGALKVNSAGGYNGGGLGSWDNRDDETSGGGGGATHIAKVSGLLATLESNKDSIIMVSGGAGGQSLSYQAGSGGGFQGGISTETNQSIVSQNGGYAFGKGQDAIGTADSDGVGGGGGGFYGGYMNNVNKKSSGSGGSGYIGNTELTNKVMYCYGCTESTDNETYTINTLGTNDTLDKTACPDGYSSEPISKCAKSGNGYARITFVNDAN